MLLSGGRSRMETQRPPACNAPCQRGLWMTLKKLLVKQPCPVKDLAPQCLCFHPKGIALPPKGAAPGQREARGCTGTWGSRSSIWSRWQPLGRR